MAPFCTDHVIYRQQLTNVQVVPIAYSTPKQKNLPLAIVRLLRGRMFWLDKEDEALFSWLKIGECVNSHVLLR